MLSGGRALPAFGLGIVHPVEQQAFGVERGDRASIFDEALPLLRRLWAEDDVDHDGTWFHYEHMNVLPKPAHPLDVWLGGKAPSELRRVGRLADGWLASFTTPEQCKAGAGRDRGGGRRRRPRDRPRALRRDGVLHARRDPRRVRAGDPDAAIPTSRSTTSSPAAGRQLHDLCARYVAVGFSKLVLVPLSEPATGTTSSRPARRRCSRCRADPRSAARHRRLRLEEAAQADDRADHADAGADQRARACRCRARRTT